MRNLIWNALLTMLLTAACEDWQPDDVYFDPSQTSDAISTCTDNHLRPQYYFPKIIFQGGTEGYEHYRIPSIIRAKNGNLIAIAEGRKFSEDDYGDIDVVYKISYDNGENFGPLKLLFSKWDGTCGNPTPVLDWDTGAIWIFMSYNEAGYSQFGDEGTTEITEWGQRRVYSKVSRDNGETWGELVNRTTDLLPKGQAWDAMGPGNGIQLDSGRLVIPAINRNIYSDDHGATWDYQMIRSGTSEGTIVQLTNGDLMRNDRAASIKLK